MVKKKLFVDLFCGAGGEHTGVKRSLDRHGIEVEAHAVNHWTRAIETHSENHPEAEHHIADVFETDPDKVAPGGEVALLWASPACTHHSNARGGKPRDDQSRAGAEVIFDWVEKCRVGRIIIENVKEFLTWGPLTEEGKVDKERKGEYYDRFVVRLRSKGYIVEWRVLNAADYGACTSRERLFMQACLSDKKIIWPEPTHSRASDSLPYWNSVSSCIDWSIPGKSIFHRKRALADNTMRRIAKGVEKYWSPEYLAPFMVHFKGTGTHLSLEKPIPTICAGGKHFGLVKAQPFVTTIDNASASTSGSPISSPLSTIVTKQRHAVVQLKEKPSLITSYYGSGTNASETSSPLPTIVTKSRHALLQVEVGLDITLRMLNNAELMLAQGFDRTYKLLGTEAEKTKQIGNSVPPDLADALVDPYLVNGAFAL